MKLYGAAAVLSMLPIALVSVCVNLHAAAAYGELPTLGNTPQADDHLSIEVNDSFVWQNHSPVVAEARPADWNVWEKIQHSNRMPVHLNPIIDHYKALYLCLLYTSPSPRDRTRSRMPSSA